jgi:hypothetical protein
MGIRGPSAFPREEIGVLTFEFRSQLKQMNELCFGQLNSLTTPALLMQKSNR